MSEQKKCRGCGSVLQNQDPQQFGYAPNLEMEYCQRCFKMIHYDQHVNDSQLPDSTQVFALLEKQKGRFIWIMDVSDLESSLNCEFSQFYRQHECDIILNKCDVIPSTVTISKLISYLKKRLKTAGILFGYIFIRGKDEGFAEQFISHYKNEKRYIMTGLSNVGKSTIINDLLKENVVTVNRHPATTLEVNTIETEFGTLIDTVGLVNQSGIQAYLKSADLKSAVAVRQMKPMVFQIHQDQSFAIGSIARIDLKDCKKATVVFYCSQMLEIHRGQIRNARKYWSTLHSPALKCHSDFADMKEHSFPHDQYKLDYCIAGLGWITVSGNVKEVNIYCDEPIAVSKREAMI